MPLNKDAYLRYRLIDQCLTNKQHKFPTKEYILSKIEEVIGRISVSSLEKDIGKMKELFDAPIYFDRARKGYCYTQEDFSLNGIPLTHDEITALDFSTSVLQVLKHTPLFKNFEGAIEKVISGYRVGKILGKSDEELIQVESPLGNSGVQWIERMYQAIIEKQVVEISYRGFDKDPSVHLYSPFLLKEYRNRWYGVGYSNKHEKTIVLALDRIKSITDTKEKYFSNPDFDPKEYFKYSFGVTQMHEKKPETVVLSFQHLQANYVLSQPLHYSQKVIAESDTEVRVELLVYITQELKMTILSFGSGVKVIAPAKLIEEIKHQVALMKKLY